MPATRPVPPPLVPAVASAAPIGEVAAERTPPQRSPRADVALRVTAGVVVRAAALLRAFEGVAALEDEVGAETCARATCVPEVTAGVRGCAACAGAVLRGWLVVRAAPELRVAPLTVAEALVEACAGLLAGAPDVVGGVAVGVAGVAGAVAVGVGGVTTGVAGVALTTGGATVGVGGAAGVAGVPKPCGVQAQAMPTPTTATPSTDRTDRNMMRACRCKWDPSSDWCLDLYGKYTVCLHEPDGQCKPNFGRLAARTAFCGLSLAPTNT
jgi:hypothetical protein